MDNSESDIDSVRLGQMLPMPVLLAYAIPLLILSTPLTFAGAFLTLDRTRSFVPSGKMTSAGGPWRFEGGVGGVLAGFLFGMHLSTLLSLLIMNRTGAGHLGHVQFLVIWVLSGALLAVVGARFRVAALLFLGNGGGVAVSLFWAIVANPAPLARTILFGVMPAIISLLCFVPIPRVQHGATRFSSASMGAAGVTLAIALFAGIQGWQDIWARLWVRNDANWNTPGQKGLSAGFAVITAVGVGVDWILKRKLGENPDAKWDSYLASYASNLPNAHDRAGSFQPAVPFWKRIFDPPARDPTGLGSDLEHGASRRRSKSGKLKTRGKGDGTQFQPLATKGDFSSGSDDSADSEVENSRYIPRPWANKRGVTASTSRTSLSGATLAGSENLRGKDKGYTDYSDGESAVPTKQRSSRDLQGWTPDFLKRQSSTSTGKGKGREVDGIRLEPLSPTTPAPLIRGSDSTAGDPPPGAVPMTPSLLNALDRVSRAQHAAHAGSSPPSVMGKH